MRRQLVAVAGLCAAAACTPPAATGNAGDAGRWNVADACAILNKATVGAVLGTDVTRAELTPGSSGENGGASFSTCSYTLASGGQAAFLARQSPAADNDPAAFAKMQDEVAQLTGPVEPVTGVGAHAFWVPKLRQLHVFLGTDRYYNLTMPATVGNKDPKTVALALATRIE